MGKHFYFKNTKVDESTLKWTINVVLTSCQDYMTYTYYHTTFGTNNPLNSV